MSLQGCLASRKDCSGKGKVLSKPEIMNICKSTYQAAPLNDLFIVLPDGRDYKGGIYKYNDDGLNLLTENQKTKYTMEIYPELIKKDNIDIEDLIRIGLSWQYLSLKVESLGLGVSQRAMGPKKVNKIINEITNQEHLFLYSVAVRERDLGALIEDKTDPYHCDLKEGTIMLEMPKCYEDRALYKGIYKGIELDKAIFNEMDKKSPNNKNLNEISQLLWACQGETDHAAHGNRDGLEKNGYGRVHASGCAGYSIYPIVMIDELVDISKGAYFYNPVGFSALNRWVKINDQITYDHFLQKYSTLTNKDEIENEFSVKYTNYLILLCMDRKKPCSGFFHSKILDVTNWAEIEAGMALAGLQLQANALGLLWKKHIISNPKDPKYRKLLDLDSAENEINNLAENLANKAKNEHLSLVSHLEPILLFYFENNLNF
ncbi:MAG: hypothetical protein JXA99_17435 [Candidatus Lokiarchaeota archaeon]|nr:hypothetical protein [Candidatus Lokiarchaeota archaeon]